MVRRSERLLSGSGARQTLTMNSNKTVTAHWERIPATTYTLRAIANPDGGYVEISGGTSVTAGTKRFNHTSDRRTLQLRLAFVRWSGDLSGSGARRTVTMNSNKTVTALFQRATNQRTLTAHVVGNGRVNPSGSTSHDDGTIVALQAIPDRGYRLRGWSGSVSGTDPWITVRMNQDHVAIATFERATTARYELSVSVSGRGTVSGAGTYEAGRTVTLQATPDRGHRFVRWRGDATGSSFSATIQMNDHKVVEALFERDDSTSLGSSDQIELRSEQPFSGVAIGDIITLRATVTRPNGGRVPDATPVELTSQDQGVLMSLERSALSTRNGEVSARFVVVRLGRVVLLTQAAGDVLVSTVNVGGQSRFQVRVTASPANGGRVSGAGSYQSGRQIALRATPNEGFRFVRWEGGASGTRSSLTLRVTADATVRAVFERSSYTLTVQANPAGGSAGRVEIEGGTLVRPGQKRFTSGERATLTAHTSTGWSFGGWSGDLRGSQPVQAIVIDADKSVTAQWVRSEQRAALFSRRSLPDRTWQVGQPVNSTLPAASGGSGLFTYSIRYEWSGNQTWTPTGVSFDRNSRRLSGVPRMQLDPNPALRRFTVFLRADDRARTGQWDELQFVVNLSPAPTAQPTSSTTETVSAQIVARRLSDGQIEFALQPAGAARILPRSRFFPARPRIGSWLNSTAVVHLGTTLGRISARRLSDGRTEFGFFPLTGGERILPRTRMFPSSTVNRSWLSSNTFAIPFASNARGIPVEEPASEPDQNPVAASSCFVSLAGQTSQTTLNAQRYGLGNQPYWLIRVPNSAIHAAADHGHLSVPISVVVNLSTVRSGSAGLPSGPCLSPNQEADDWDHDDRGAFGLGVTVDHSAGLRGIWTHDEPYGHDGGHDAQVRLNDRDRLAKWGHLGKLLHSRGQYGSSGADATEFVKDVSPNQSRVGRINLSFRFPVTSEDSGVAFHVYDSERHKTWYAFSLDLLQKDRKYGPAGSDALRADDWHHVQRTNVVVVVDPDPDADELFRTRGHFDHSHDLTHDQFDIIVNTAKNATDPETWLKSVELWEDAITEVGAWAADWAIEKLGLPHDVDLECMDHPDVDVTEPDVSRFVKLLQGCAHDRGPNKTAQLRVGNPSRVWVEVKSLSGGATPESDWLLPGMLWPGAIENWEPDQIGQITLRSELTTGAVIATVVGELIFNALDPIISAALAGYITSADMRLIARAAIHYLRESVNRKSQIDLRDITFSELEGLSKAILDEVQQLLPEAINEAATYAFERLADQVSEETTKALLQGPLSKASLNAALLKAEVALAVWRYSISIGQLIGLATLDEQSRHAFGSVSFSITESACPECPSGQ